MMFKKYKNEENKRLGVLSEIPYLNKEELKKQVKFIDMKELSKTPRLLNPETIRLLKFHLDFNEISKHNMLLPLPLIEPDFVNYNVLPDSSITMIGKIFNSNRCPLEAYYAFFSNKRIPREYKVKVLDELEGRALHRVEFIKDLNVLSPEDFKFIMSVESALTLIDEKSTIAISHIENKYGRGDFKVADTELKKQKAKIESILKIVNENHSDIGTKLDNEIKLLRLRKEALILKISQIEMMNALGLQIDLKDTISKYTDVETNEEYVALENRKDLENIERINNITPERATYDELFKLLPFVQILNKDPLMTYHDILDVCNKLIKKAKKKNLTVEMMMNEIKLSTLLALPAKNFDLFNFIVKHNENVLDQIENVELIFESLKFNEFELIQINAIYNDVFSMHINTILKYQNLPLELIEEYKNVIDLNELHTQIFISDDKDYSDVEKYIDRERVNSFVYQYPAPYVKEELSPGLVSNYLKMIAYDPKNSDRFILNSLVEVINELTNEHFKINEIPLNILKRLDFIDANLSIFNWSVEYATNSTLIKILGSKYVQTILNEKSN